MSSMLKPSLLEGRVIVRVLSRLEVQHGNVQLAACLAYYRVMQRKA